MTFQQLHFHTESKVCSDQFVNLTKHNSDSVTLVEHITDGPYIGHRLEPDHRPGRSSVYGIGQHRQLDSQMREINLVFETLRISVWNFWSYFMNVLIVRGINQQ